jgi:alkylation response protein AidB-like acyl-CoA dehydrogenase
VDWELTEANRAWLDEVRDVLRECVSPELQAEARRNGSEWNGPHARGFRRALAERGWLAMTWPTEEGGLGRSAFEQFLFMDECAYWGAPSIDLTSTSIAPTLLRAGSPEQRRRWLPAIRRGEVDFALGYSEPDAGSDLASLRTQARHNGDTWVINGSKIWNTGAEHASHEWLVARTDPEAPQHRGLSVFIVPLDAAGITVQELRTWGGIRTNLVFFDNVRVPADNVVGELHRGWRQITTALDFERVAIGITGGLRRLLEELVAYVREQVVDGVRLADRGDIRALVADMTTRVELARLLNYRAAWMIDAGAVPNAEASMTKVTTSELHAQLAGTALRIAGMPGRLEPGAEHAPMAGLAQHGYRQAPYLRFGGGTNEIQRDIIAQRGLGLPRAR